jgi:hypothetical protein
LVAAELTDKRFRSLSVVLSYNVQVIYDPMLFVFCFVPVHTRRTAKQGEVGIVKTALCMFYALLKQKKPNKNWIEISKVKAMVHSLLLFNLLPTYCSFNPSPSPIRKESP